MVFFTQGIQGTSEPDLIVKKCLQRLLMEPSVDAFDGREMLRLFRAMMVTRDPVLMAAFRRGLRVVLQNLGTGADDRKQDIIAYILCLLPHAEPKPSEPPYEIPTWNAVQERWDMVGYNVRPIELTSTCGPEAFVMTDRERVFAYGLEPICVEGKDTAHVSSILLLKGIPVLAGQGFATQWFAEGFATPGSWLLYTGHVSLQKWLNGKSVNVFGAGQGGAQACSLATNPSVEFVYAYNPSNLGTLATSQLPSQWQGLAKKPQVHIIDQNNKDIYSYLNHIFPEWTIRHITVDKTATNWMGRMLCYAAHCSSEISEIEKKDMTADLHRRWAFYLMANQIWRYLAFGLLALPCRFVVLPAVRALHQHKTEALLISVLVFAGMMFPGMFGAPLGITAVIAASIYLVGQLSTSIYRFIGFTPAPEAICHMVEPETVNSLQQELSLKP